MDGMQAAPSPTGIPGTAPPMLWLAMCTTVALWWMWPWLDRWFSAMKEPSIPAGAPGGLAASSACAADARAEKATFSDDGMDQFDEEASDMGLPAAPLGFEPSEEFDKVFEDVCRLLGQLLDVPPVGAEYAAANAAIHKTAAVLDRIFEAWGCPEELARVSHLREGSAAFRRTYGGDHRVGRLARQLLEAAGFQAFESHAAASRLRLVSGEDAEAHESDDDDDDDDAEKLDSGIPSSSSRPAERSPVWVFIHEEAICKLRAMAVRLCLHKHAELQKMRGTMRWVQDSNAHVLPKLGDGCLAELLGLCRETRSKLELPADPSQRERLAEVALRVKINERRQAAGCKVPLLMHDGLTAAARMFAMQQRKRVRDGGDMRPSRPIDLEVQNLLLRAPLPPGFDAAHLHFASDELPHIFGLADTRGGSSTGSEGGSTAADILANEAVGFWAARQLNDLVWPYAAVCGIGAALDYTVNRGFMVALLIGYEHLEPLAEEHGALATAGAEMRQRKVNAEAAANARGGAATLQKKGEFGARVKTLNSGTTSGFTHRKW